MKTIIENKNLLIDNIENRENYITMSRPTFVATIRGREYEISAQYFNNDTLEDIQIISLNTFEEIYFEDENVNDQIKEELYNIIDNNKYLTY